MAEFNADINLDVKVERALAKINKVDRALNGLGRTDAEVRVKVDGLKQAEKAAARLYAQLEKLESATLSKLPRQVQLLVAYLKVANQSVGELAGRLAVAATLTGKIAGVSLAPLTKQLKNASALLFDIEKAQVRFINTSKFSPKLTGFNPKGILDGLDLVNVRVLNTQKALDGLDKVRVRTIFTEKILDGLDLVKVRIIEIAGLLKSTFGAGYGAGAQRLLPAAGGTGGGAGGGGGGGGGGGRGGALAPIQSFPNSQVNDNTLAGLSKLANTLNRLYRSAEIGSDIFNTYARALDLVSAAARKAQAGADLAIANPRTIQGQEKRRNALQELIGQAEVGSKEFLRLRGELDKVNKEIQESTNLLNQNTNARRNENAQQQRFERTISGIRKRKRNERVQELRQRRDQRTNAVGSGIIGGAFPLLFGQGVGASIGGAAGGLGGGLLGGNLGFGLSLVGTALGAQFDALSEGAKETAKALARPAENFKELNENLRLFDRAAAQSIQASIELGRAEEANAIIRQRVAQSIGVDGVRSLDELNEAAKTADKAFAELGLQLQAFVAGPLAAFLRALAEGGKEQGTYFKNNERIRKLQGLLDPADREKLDREIFKQSFKVDTLFGIPTGVKQGDQDKIAKILDKFEEIIAYLPKPEVDEAKQTPQDKLNQNISKLQDGLKTLSTKQTVLGISDSFLKAEEDRAKAQRDNDKQRADIIRSYEESLASLRESVERRVQQLRLQTIQKENDAINQRVRNQLQALQTQNAAAASDRETEAIRAGTAPEIFAGTEGIQQAFAQLKEQQLSLEEEKARLQRETALEVLKITLDGEKFRFDITQRVAKLNLSTARQIEAINLNIETANNIATKYRFDLEMAIAKARLDVVEAEAKLTRLTLVDSAPGSAGVQQVQQLLDAIRDEKLELDNFKQPAPLPLVEAPQLGGVDIAKEVEAVNKLVEANRQLLAVKLQNLELKNKDVLQDTAIQTNNAILESEKGVNAELANRQRIQSEIEESRKLQSKGLNKEQADQLARFRTGQNIRIATLKKQKTDLEQLRVQFAGNADAVDLIDNSLANVDTTLANVISKGNQTEELIKKQAEGLALVKEIATDIGAQLASGITSALVDAVEGTKSLGEAFQELAADILKAIGEALILAAITKAIGVAGGGGTQGSGLLGLLFKKDGGPVNSNQPYIVGEEGPELFIPGVSGAISNNDQFAAAYDAMSGESGSSSATGEGGLGGSEVSSAFAQNNSTITSTSSYMRERAMERESQTTIGSAGSMVIETQVINNVEYATVEQMRIANAATAKKARAEVFADLKNKPSARAAVGMR